jgi:hypothetical protein
MPEILKALRDQASDVCRIGKSKNKVQNVKNAVPPQAAFLNF